MITACLDCDGTGRIRHRSRRGQTEPCGYCKGSGEITVGPLGESYIREEERARASIRARRRGQHTTQIIDLTALQAQQPRAVRR